MALSRSSRLPALPTISEEELQELVLKLKLSAVSGDHRHEAVQTASRLLELVTCSPALVETLAAEPGLLSVLHSLLSAYNTSEATLLSGLALLASLAGGPAACKDSICSSRSRVVRSLMALLQDERPAVAAAAARCLKLLSEDQQPEVCEKLLAKHHSIQSGAVLLAKLVRRGAESHAAAAWRAAAAEAAGTLHNLAAVVPASLLEQKGVLSALLAGVRSSSSSSVQLLLPSMAAVAALAAATQAAQAAAKARKGPKLIAAVAALLEHQDPEVVIEAARALGGFAQHCRSLKASIASASVSKGKTVMAALIVLLNSRPDSPAVGTSSAAALAALLDECPANVRLLSKQPGVVDLLMSTLRGVELPVPLVASGKKAAA